MNFRNWLIGFKYFYKEYTIYNLIFTVICLWFLVRYGRYDHAYIFWIKFVGFLGTGFFYYQRRKKYLYFFYNLGLDKKSLILFSILIDTIITLVIFNIAYSFI